MWRSHVVESQYRVFREGSQGWEGECRNKCPVCCSNNGICCYWASFIHPYWILFFLWWWGPASDKSPLNQIPGLLHGSVKRNSSGKTTTKPLTNMDEQCFHRLCGGLASYSCPPSFTKPAWCVCLSSTRAFFAEKPPQLLSLWQTASRKTTIIFNYGTFAIGFLFFVCCLSLFFFFLSRTLHTANERASVPEWWVGINQRSTSYPEHLDSSRQCVPHLHVVA